MSAQELDPAGDATGAAKQLKEALSIKSQDSEAKALLDTLSKPGASVKLPLERIKRNYDESSFRQLAAEIENANEIRLRQTDPATHAAFHVQRGHQLLLRRKLQRVKLPIFLRC